MKLLPIYLILMAPITIIAQNGVAYTTKKMFSRETKITVEIKAHPERIWEVLTNAPGYTQWNSTVLSMQGTIEEGKKIKLVSYLAPERTFSLKIKKLIPPSTLIWGDALGKRTFTLSKQGAFTKVTMHEKIGSLFYPLFANKIPDFDESFETFMKDLKTESEK